MQIEYKRDLQNNYMILEAVSGANESEYQLKMAEENEINGLLSFHSGKKDGKLYLYYEITSKQSIENLYARKLLSRQDILFLLNGISAVLEELQKYLLNSEFLLFDPQFIFTYPDKSRIFLCYLPGEKGYPITGLAEFILKRLDHEDVQAVALGYQFYQKVLEENFSLQQTLKEILLIEEEKNSDRRNLQKENITFPDDAEEEMDKYEDHQNCCEINRRNLINQEKKNGHNRKIEAQEDSERESRLYEKGFMEYSGKENVHPEEEYEVIHKVRKKKSKYKVAADWLFERVHPGIVVSSLVLIAAVEIVYCLKWISLTEAGGIFFFIVSIEILINNFWKSRTKQKHQNWWEEEEEEYQKLQHEVYQDIDSAESQEEFNEMEETRCLLQEKEKKGLRLVCLNNTQSELRERGMYPDILIEKMPIYIGKLKKDVDILLDSSTISRIHACLEQKGGKYYVKDLNSKNGTFVNERRLMPQEQCEIVEGDRIAFAEILYQAEVSSGSYSIRNYVS